MTNDHKTSLIIGEKSSTYPQDGCSNLPNPAISKEEEVTASQAEGKSEEAGAAAETVGPSLHLLTPPLPFDSYCLTLWANSFHTTPTSSVIEAEETECPSVRMKLLISSSASSYCPDDGGSGGGGGGGGSGVVGGGEDNSFPSLAPKMQNHHHGYDPHHPSVGLPSGYPALHRNIYPPPDDDDALDDNFLDLYSHVSITDNKCHSSQPHDSGHHHSQTKPLSVSNNVLGLQDDPSLFSVLATTSHHVSAENDCSQQNRIAKATHHPHHNKRQRRSHYALGAKDFYDQILIKVFDDDTSNDYNVNLLATSTWS